MMQRVAGSWDIYAVSFIIDDGHRLPQHASNKAENTKAMQTSDSLVVHHTTIIDVVAILRLLRHTAMKSTQRFIQTRHGL